MLDVNGVSKLTIFLLITLLDLSILTIKLSTFAK